MATSMIRAALHGSTRSSLSSQQSTQSLDGESSSRRGRGSRRGGNKWSASLNQGNLTPVVHPVRGCLKVLTQEDSLAACEPNKKNDGRMKGLRKLAGSLTPRKKTKKVVESESGEGKGGNPLLDITEDDTVEVVPPSQQKIISFVTITIREYNLEAGDSPDVSKGPALTLGWKFTEKPPVTVDEYEASHPPRANAKRLGEKEREEMLTQTGVTKEEMCAAMRSSQAARKKRKETVKNLHKMKQLEKRESAIESLKRSFFLKKSQEEMEDVLWTKAQRNNSS